MRRHHITALVLIAVLGITGFSAYAADELFDTTAAAKHLEQGLTYLKAKKIDAAIGEFEESAAILPEAEAYYYLGYAYYLKGRSGDGESRTLSRENFEKAYEIDPNFSPTRLKPTEHIPIDTPQQSEQGAAAPAESQPATQPTATPVQPKP